MGLIGLIRDDFRITDAQIAKAATLSRWAIMDGIKQSSVSLPKMLVGYP